jgi:NTP pyrophosphatase (non-canonical NTP hydrolase)
VNRTEHLLECLSEECSEVGQRVSKALRFGLEEVQADQPLRNMDRITEELMDVICVAHILAAEGIINFPFVERLDIEAKRNKIEKFMAISREQGVLTQ